MQFDSHVCEKCRTKRRDDYDCTSSFCGANCNRCKDPSYTTACNCDFYYCKASECKKIVKERGGACFEHKCSFNTCEELLETPFFCLNHDYLNNKHCKECNVDFYNVDTSKFCSQRCRNISLSRTLKICDIKRCCNYVESPVRRRCNSCFENHYDNVCICCRERKKYSPCEECSFIITKKLKIKDLKRILEKHTRHTYLFKSSLRKPELIFNLLNICYTKNN